MLLVDTSVWVAARLDAGQFVNATSGVVVICPPVLQELLQGARDRVAYRRIHERLLRHDVLDATMPLERYEQAARLYVECREAGVTPRNSVDCLIAAIAIAHDIELLHMDRDFDLMAKVIPLKARRL